MKNKFIGTIVAIAVVLSMVMVPAVALATPGDPVGLKVVPAETKVGFGESFDLEVWTNTADPADTSDGVGAYLNFSPTYMTVNSIAAGVLPMGLASSFDNLAGTIDYAAGTLTPIAGDYLVCTINCTSGSTNGISTVDFVIEGATRVTDVTLLGSSIMGWGLVVNGTLKVGSPELTVAVSPAGMGDVKVDGAIPGSYPDVSSWTWDEVVDLEAVDSMAGWTFDSWTGDVASPGAVTTITISEDKSVTANFVELDPEIGLSTTSLSFVTYEGVNPLNQTFDITNIGGQTLCWGLGEQPTWAVGDWWNYANMYQPFPPLPIPGSNFSFVNVSVVGGGSGSDYQSVITIAPPLQRTMMGGMPCILYSGSMVTDETTLDIVSQVGIMGIYPYGLPPNPEIPVQANLSWAFDGCHGWPYYLGKSWTYNLTMDVKETIGWTLVDYKIIPAMAVVTNWNVTLGAWEISHLALPSMTPFMQTYWSPTAKNFVVQADGGTYDYPPMDIRSLVAFSSAPAPAGLPAWLSASPIGGALVGNGASQTVTVDVDAAGPALTVGDYNANIVVTGASSETVAVSLTVKPATYIPSERDLPGNAVLPDETYPGMTFDVYVNFTASADGLNSIGLTDVAPDGWMVQVDKTWCNPAAYAVQKWGNEVEIMWAGPYSVGDNFSAMYKVTVPETANPGINTWEVCPDMDEAWLEYYFGLDGPHSACISGEYQMMITVPGDVVGETRDVNANELSDVDVLLLKQGVGALISDASTPDYSNTAITTGMYWQVATKALYYTINMTGMTMLPDEWINLSTPELLAAGEVFDFEANFGLVPRACDMWYAQKSVNLWLFPPALEYDIYMNVINDWGIDEWKALDSIHSWQFPS